MDYYTDIAGGHGRFGALVIALMLAVGIPDGLAEALVAADAPWRARVVEIYEDRAIVEIDGKRFLVEPVVPGRPFPAATGWEIEVHGTRRGNVLVPGQIGLPSGAVVQSDAARTPPAASGPDRGMEGQLAAHGITVAGRPYRRRNSTVVAGQTGDGRKVIVSFDHNLRLVEIEEADHTHIHPSAPEALPEPDVARRLADLGYSSIRLIDRSRFRFLYAASGPQGERMELHVDRAGNILKRVWLR